MNSKTPTLFTDDDRELELPWKWQICSSCDGHGTTQAHVECDGGGFTSSEWADQDDDFRSDYIANRFARPCPHCEGGKVKVADKSRMPADQISDFEAQQRDDADYDRLCRMERMLGA